MTESFLPRVNGVTNSVCRVLEHLADNGHEAIVVAPTPGPDMYAGFRVHTVPGFALPMYPQFVVGLPTTKVEDAMLSFRPDVVHLASPTVLGASGLAAARRLGLPSVAVFQTDIAGFVKRNGFRGADNLIWTWLRRLHMHADRTLVPSTATMKQLRERRIPRLKMWGRGVDLERFHPKHHSAELRRELAPNGETLIGYVGRLSADKRVRLLTHLADLPSTRLVVVGDGPAEEQLRRSMPGAAFLGFRTGQELSEAMASLDVFVHTGADETFCQVVQEALAAGLPVVAPAAGGPLDLVAPGRTGFLYSPDSVEALRAATARLAGDPELRADMGVRARASVAGRSWAAVCDELLAHYEDVLAVPRVRLSDAA